jgi:hypothetical protein
MGCFEKNIHSYLVSDVSISFWKSRIGSILLRPLGRSRSAMGRFWTSEVILIEMNIVPVQPDM